ncbi:retrotransposon protein, putative, ty1-copia subclass [Tanacetum coccineum]|uniref:Retrotransposon protein, putative, ty1-copia subclass n=1 Tax=Tanacetum coccineum TaxID=301880 RepID=A0ABQ5BLA8_9ASTR
MYVIEQPLPAALAADSQAQVLSQWNAVYDAYNEVACLILGSMTPELHRQFENSSPYDMIKELKSMFEKQAGVERFDLIQTFHACKQEEGKPVAAYVLRMKAYVDQPEHLGYMLPQDLIIGLILNSLTKDFAGFVRNYNMYNMGKTIGKLHAMLIEYEKVLPKKAETPQVMMVKGGKIQKANKKSLKAKGKGKANGKGKDKQVYTPKPKNPKPSAKEHPAKDDTCHHCKERSKETETWSTLFIRGQWYRAQVEAIGSYDLVLPNGLVICLDNCHYVPSITRGVVSVHRLVENGFVQCFTDFRIFVSKNNVFYFNAIPSNGIYEIDMHDLVPNVNSIYNVSTKRAKHNLDSTYLWNCRLAHISKKRIERLQQEGLLKSTDDESFDQCVSCLSGKMTRKSFPHRPERATDLLGIIHTDVCGPLRHVSRQGVAPFIIHSMDYSRYGQSRLSRLRSMGWRYIAKEFKDYLKACGIVQQLTPPYTPQHNGVSERRNRTFLDMVRSMMNLTTLSLSFWDYALESTTRILNMVPTKKVDKTPYELWYGKVPNLSYLKVWGCEALVKRDMPDKV